MVWVTFRSPFIFVPPEDRRCAVKYPAGYRGSVRRACEAQAREAGVLVEEVSDDQSGPAPGAGDLPEEGT